MINISTSALKPSQYRQYVKGWNKERYADLFRKYTGDRNNYRIHLPLVAGAKRVAYAPVPEAIQKSVAEKGYVVEDYITGIAVDVSGKRRIKIGKLLSPELQQVFANDKTRSNARNAASGNQMIVISRHPYDVAGMSTDRGWVSCMHLVGGSNAHYVKDDIKHGSIIAYLVNKDDLNLQRPSARILLRVYKADNGKKGLFPSGIYGARSQLFFDTVRKWCSEVNATYFGIPYGMTMDLLDDLYNDGRKTIVNDNYNPETALKDLEATLRANPKSVVEELGMFETKFGSDVSEFYSLVNSIRSKEMELRLAESAVLKMRILVEDNNVTLAYKDCAEIAARGYCHNPITFTTNDALALIRVSALMGQKLLTEIDAIKVAAATVRVDDSLSMPSLYERLLKAEASRPLLDAAPKFGLSQEKALSLMTRDNHNNWHRVVLTKEEIKILRRTWKAEGVDELPPYYEMALAPATKMPAAFKKYLSDLNAEILRGVLTGRANRPNDFKLILERMPADKWASAFRGVHLLPLLANSTFQRQIQDTAFDAMRPYLAKRFVDFCKGETKRGSYLLRILVTMEGSLSGRQYGGAFFRAVPDEVWMEPAAMLIGLGALLNGSGSRAATEGEMGITGWIAESPIRVMALANTEDFNGGPFAQVMQAIESDPSSCYKMIAMLKQALAAVPSFSRVVRDFPLLQAAYNVQEAADEAEENGTTLAQELQERTGALISTRAAQILLDSHLADV